MKSISINWPEIFFSFVCLFPLIHPSDKNIWFCWCRRLMKTSGSADAGGWWKHLVLLMQEADKNIWFCWCMQDADENISFCWCRMLIKTSGSADPECWWERLILLIQDGDENACFKDGIRFRCNLIILKWVFLI